MGSLGKGAALLAQDIKRAVDRAIVDFSTDFFHLCVGQRSEADLGENLKNRIKRQLACGRSFFFGDARLPGNPQIGLVGSIRKRLADFVIHDLVLHCVAITLRDHIHRHLAGPKAVHLDSASELAQTRLHLSLDAAYRQRQRHFALEFFQGFYMNSHQASPKIYVVRGGGLEPPQYCYRQDLNLVRLPISPPAQKQRGCPLEPPQQISEGRF